MTATDFKQKFDEKGRYRDASGEEGVAFVTRNRRRYAGQLHFRQGLCVRAQMEGGGDWSLPEESPLNEIRFLLQFDGAKPLAVAVDQGLIRFEQSPEDEASKKQFLAKFRVARNLFVHPKVLIDCGEGDPKTIEHRLIRSAIWLTPKTVAGYNINHFPELGPARQRDLDAAVKGFREVADLVPTDGPATDDQYRKAAGFFAKILEILTPYLPIPEESRKIEKALATIAKDLPPWVLNWDYEVGSDSEGVAAVWVNVFTDDETAPVPSLGKYLLEWITIIRTTLATAGVDRWPYVQVRSGGEYKARA